MNKTETKQKPIKQNKNSKCYFTQTGTKPNYKDVLILKRFISERGKILSQDKTGLTAKNQRLVTVAIKQARHMALVPYTDQHAN